MVIYVQCKYCYDEDKHCKYCNGSGYIEKRTFYSRCVLMLYCVFPCLDEKNHKIEFRYKNVSSEPDFYEDLFNSMNDIENTVLIEETNIG